MSFPNYPAYKDSGVEWLGEVPQNWSVYSLKRTVDGCVNGLWGDEPDGENDIAVIRVADFERSFSTVGLDKLTYRSITPKERQSRLIKSGDLLIEKSGGGEKTLVGCVVLFTHEFDAITSNFVARMRPLAEFDSQFLCYAFGNLYQGRVNYPSVKQVTGIQNLDAESYLQERFCFPTRVEQTQIARFLDHETARIDALIAEQQRLIELLKEKRQAVISHAVTKGLDPTVPMKDSGVEWLGEVPEHWNVVAIKWLSPVLRGASPRPIDDPKYFDETGEYAWVRIADVSASDGTLRETTQTLSALGASLSVKIEPGDMFLSIAGTVGKPCITQIKACIHDGFVYFPSLKIDNKFLYRIFEVGTCYGGLGKMGTQLNLNTDTVGGIQVGVPPDSEIARILENIDHQSSAFDSLISEAAKGVELLQERRSALISAAVTGKIDVRNWQPPARAQVPECEEVEAV